MPTALFAVTVTSEAETSNEAHLDAGRYLAYADRTDLFAYHGHIEGVSTSLDSEEWYVSIEFSAPVSSEDDITRWADEMAALSRVVEYECISNPLLA